MSPIEGMSDIVRLPRLGKIRLGEKVEAPGKKPYPRAVDYFICPPEVQAIFGEKPKELPIMFPTNDPDQFAQQWLRAYSLTQGLVCLGTGLTARRKVDTDTGAMASHETEKWEWKDDLVCDSQECPEYQTKRCRRVMNLQFLLPDVPGLGVWQIDTTSFYSILNINSMCRMLKALLGRCGMIPLTLALGPIEVSPAGLKKKTVYIMHLKKDIKLTELARLAALPLAQMLLPEPETEEAPEELFPNGVPPVEATEGGKPSLASIIDKAEQDKSLWTWEENGWKQTKAGMPTPPTVVPEAKAKTAPVAEGKAPETKKEGPPNRDPNSIKTIDELLKICNADFDGMQPSDVYTILEVKGRNDITDSPPNCYRRIAAARGG